MNRLPSRKPPPYHRVMAVTVEQLLSFRQVTYPSAGPFTPYTELHDQSIDGDDAVELLGLLEAHFGVAFDSFPFREYFLEEIEISRALTWFGPDILPNLFINSHL